MTMRTIETPAEMAELMRECIDVTNHYIDLVNERFCLHLDHMKILFSLRSGTAGKALIGRNTILYNPTLLRENPETFLRQTAGHEVIHHAAYSKYGWNITSHGFEWKNMMMMMGLEPRRCHNYDTSHVPSKVGKLINKQANNIIKSEHGVMRTFGIGKVIEFD